MVKNYIYKNNKLGVNAELSKLDGGQNQALDILDKIDKIPLHYMKQYKYLQIKWLRFKHMNLTMTTKHGVCNKNFDFVLIEDTNTMVLTLLARRPSGSFYLYFD